MFPNPSRIWAPCQPDRVRECRVQGAKKVMAWVGVVGNKVLPVHWFEEKKGVNGEAYLQLLKETVWPAVRTRATRNRLYFMQHRAIPHTNNQVMQFQGDQQEGRV